MSRNNEKKVSINAVVYAALLELFMTVADQADGGPGDADEIIGVYHEQFKKPEVQKLYGTLCGERLGELEASGLL